MRTWEPWPRSTRRGTTATTRNGGAAWRRNPSGSVGKTTRRKSLTKSLTRSSAALRPGRSRGSRESRSAPKTSRPARSTPAGNSLYLMSRAIREGRGDNRWGTYNQIREAGGQVRKGEKGTQVLFFTDRTAKAAKDEQGKTLKDKEGKTIYEEEQRSRPSVSSTRCSMSSKPRGWN